MSTSSTSWLKSLLNSNIPAHSNERHKMAQFKNNYSSESVQLKRFPSVPKLASLYQGNQSSTWHFCQVSKLQQQSRWMPQACCHRTKGPQSITFWPPWKPSQWCKCATSHMGRPRLYWWSNATPHPKSTDPCLSCNQHVKEAVIGSCDANNVHVWVGNLILEAPALGFRKAHMHRHISRHKGESRINNMI